MNPTLLHGIHKKELLVKRQEQKQRHQQIQDAALKEARRLATVLVEEYGVERVYVFGPLSYEEYHEGMPLDLAAEGLSSQNFAKALAHLRQLSTFPIELTDLHQADSWTKRSIREKGRIVAKRSVSTPPIL